MYYIIDKDGKICGKTLTPFDHPDGWQLVAEADYSPDPVAALTAAAQQFIDSVAGLDTVPPFERDSWASQALEAQAWAADHDAETPILAGIAKARGVPLNILRERALMKSNAYTALTASVAGQRQAFEDRIHAAADLDALLPMTPATDAGGEA